MILLPSSATFCTGTPRLLTTGDAHCVPPSFERSDASLEHCGGRVADAGVAVPVHLQVEQRRSMLGAIKFISDCLVNRHAAALGS